MAPADCELFGVTYVLKTVIAETRKKNVQWRSASIYLVCLVCYVRAVLCYVSSAVAVPATLRTYVGSNLFF